MFRIFWLVATVMLAVMVLGAVAPVNSIAKRKKKDGPKVLPQPTWENSFQFWIQRSKGAGYSDWSEEHKDIVKTLGGGGIYLHLNHDCSKLSDEYRRETGQYQSFAWNSPLDSGNPAYRTSDRRARQWDQNGTTVSDADKKQHGNPADNDLTMSNYCTEVVEGTKTYITNLANRYLREQETRRLKIFAGPNEFGRIFYASGKRWWDYGPYTQAEFRDWLAHRGAFAEGGTYEGKGYAGNESFADDPSPAKAKGRGKTFNATYGTKFTTWSLKFWDLELFSEPLAMNAKGMPKPETKGFTEGGFDAPRAVGQPMWGVWQNVNKEAPGYRQWRIHTSLIEMLKIAADIGVPKNEIWTRQHGFFHNIKANKNVNTAIVPWMSVTPYSNIGFNMYGGKNKPATHYAANARLAESENTEWGTFERHPSYKDPKGLSMAGYLADIRGFHGNGAHLYRACSWRGRISEGSAHGINTGDMVIKGTPFEDAIREFLKTTPDLPWKSDPDQQWLVPAPHGITVEGGTITWKDKMWENLPHKFSDWGQFEYFEVATCDSIDDNGKIKGLKKFKKVKLGKGHSLTVKADKLKSIILVRGCCKGRLEGPWGRFSRE